MVSFFSKIHTHNKGERILKMRKLLLECLMHIENHCLTILEISGMAFRRGRIVDFSIHKLYEALFVFN